MVRRGNDDVGEQSAELRVRGTAVRVRVRLEIKLLPCLNLQSHKQPISFRAYSLRLLPPA